MDLIPFFNAGVHLRNLQDHLNELASDPKKLHRMALLNGAITLDSKICATAFTGLAAGGPDVLADAGELLENHIEQLFPGMALYVKDHEEDISTFVAGLAACKDPGNKYELRPKTEKPAN